MANNSRRDTPLTIQIIDGVLTISIGVSTLAFAVQQGDSWEDMPKIVDEDIFAQDVQIELEREDDEGTNILHVLFDTVAKHAVEEGSLSVEEFKAIGYTPLTIELIEAIEGLLAEPHGCSLCDSGVMRNPAKGHQPDCPYVIARNVLGKALGDPLKDAIDRVLDRSATTYTDLIIHLTPVIHREGDMYVGWVQEVPGANAQAKSGDELRSALAEAVLSIIAEHSKR